MTNRIQNLPQQQSAPFGLVAWLEQTKIRLPLKGVECRFHACGELLNVEVDQIFHQTSAQAMDCLYTFPLPAGAAVYRCEMHVNGRLIRAKVEEQARAREIAREQRAAGRRTALVEMERENVFTLALGNVQPGDLIVIRFGYFQTLTRLADWTSLRIPFCPGERYIPGRPLLRSLRGRGVADDTDQVPDASRISPPRIEALHPDAAYLSVEGTLEDGSGAMVDVSSPSHPVLVRDGDGRCSVELAANGAVPDCDFVLRWTEKPRAELRSVGWTCGEGTETYALIRLAAPRVESALDDEAQDYYFLVDRSGSMQGLKWQKAVQAFRGFLEQLGARDRAWATFFNSGFTDFAEKPLRAAEWAEDGGLGRLESLGVDGGTELLPALRHVVKAVAKHSSGRRATLMLITDGQVGNEAEILDALRRHTDLCVHTFGIDTAVNDALLSRLASQQRGSCCLLTPADDIAGAVARLAPRLRRPVLTSIRVEGGWELPGERPADLHSEEVTLLALKSSSTAREVVITGRGPGGVEQRYCFVPGSRDEPALRLLWGKQRTESHLARGERDAAILLAKQFNLLCEGAAFIAWDEEEQVAIAEREVYQPSLGQAVICNLTEQNDTAYFGTADGAGAVYAMQRIRRDQRRERSSVSPHPSAEEPLARILRTTPPAIRSALKPETLGRVMSWFEAMQKAGQLGSAPQLRELLEVLFEWLLEAPTRRPRRPHQLLLAAFERKPSHLVQIETRLARLQALQRKLEQDAPDLASGLALTREWVASSMADSPEFSARTLAVLDKFPSGLPAG